MDRWMPFLAALGVAGGAGIGVAVLVFIAIPDDFGEGAPESAERAVVLDFADGLRRDTEKIDAAYAQACADGWAPACASSEFQGDLLAAEEALVDHCDWDDPASCLVVGWARTQRTEDGDIPVGLDGFSWDGMNDEARVGGFHEREWRGADAFDEACTSGNARACAELGRCVGWGVGRAYDPDEAMTWLTLACTLGSPEGCNWAGDVAVRRGGDSVAYFREACEMGLADGCRNLSVRDGSTEEERHDLYLEDCAVDLRSCDFLGRLYEDRGETEEALAHLAIACEGGIPGSCARIEGVLD